MRIRHCSMRTVRSTVLVSIACALLLMGHAPARAALIEFTPYESGTIARSAGLLGSGASHYRPLTSIRGYQIAMAQGVFFSQYMTFDITALDFTPLFAALIFDARDDLADLAGPGPLELWGLDVYTPANLHALPTGDLGAQLSLASALAGDLTGGTSLAPDVIGPNGLVHIDLNGAAIAQISTAGPFWGLGLYDNRFGGAIAGVTLLSTPRLVLSDRPLGAALPLPGSAALLLLALAAVRARRS